MNEGTYLIVVGAIAFISALITLYLNEQNKRSFHLIKKILDIKYNLFEESIIKFYLIVEMFNNVGLISNISFDSNFSDYWPTLISLVTTIERESGHMVISKEDFKELKGLKEDEVSSNIELLEYTKVALMNHYFIKYLEIIRETIEIRSKLELIIFDRSIIIDYGSITSKIVLEGPKLFDMDDFDWEKYVHQLDTEFIPIRKKMRNELIETLNLNSKQLQEKMKLK